MARAGQFREMVSVEREAGTGARDRYGNPAASGWAEFGAFWADIRETTGKENLAAGRLEATATATVRVRASAETRAITAADRVLARGATWSIKSPPIDPTGRGQMLEFTLERGGAVD